MNNIPAEILFNILDFTSETNPKNILQYALVCKSWKPVAEDILYKNVHLQSIRSLIKFTEVVSSNNLHLAHVVKSVSVSNLTTFDVFAEHDTDIYTLLSILPNLEKFSSLPIGCFQQIAEALSNSKLTKLKSIPQLYYYAEIEDYATCIRRLKDRLQSILVTDIKHDFSGFNRQLQLLPQLQKLEKIYVKRSTTQPIVDMESVFKKSSSSVRHIEFELDLDSLGVSMEQPSAFEPILCIDSLTLHVLNMENYEPFLSYIIDKCPALKKFRLRMINMFMMNSPFAERYITYLSKIHTVDTDAMKVNLDEVYDSIGAYWKATADRTEWKQLEHCHIKFSEKASSFYYLELKRTPEVRSQTGIGTRNPVNDDIRLNLIEKYGHLISSLDIELRTVKWHTYIRNRPDDKGMGKFILSILKHCKQLEKLSINYAGIKYMADDDEIVESTRLKELTFHECDIGHGVLSSLIGGVKTIDFIEFVNCLHRPPNYQQKPYLSIDLPNTNVGTLLILIEEPKHPHNATKYLLLSISRVVEEKNEHLYYIRDSASVTAKYPYVLKPSDADEYKGERYIKNAHFQINCQSLKRFFLSCNGPAAPLLLN